MRVKASTKKNSSSKITIILFAVLCLITFLSINMYKSQNEFSFSAKNNAEQAKQSIVDARYQEILEEEAAMATEESIEIE